MAANTCNQPPQRANGTGDQDDYILEFEYINRADVEVYVGILEIIPNIPKVVLLMPMNTSGKTTVLLD